MTTTQLTPAQVKKVAKLANLSVTPAQEEKFAGQLTGVLEFMSKIQSLDTESVPETSQVTGLTNVFREDLIDEARMFSQEEALSGAKQTHDGFFMVPAVLDEE